MSTAIYAVLTVDVWVHAIAAVALRVNAWVAICHFVALHFRAFARNVTIAISKIHHVQEVVPSVQINSAVLGTKGRVPPQCVHLIPSGAARSVAAIVVPTTSPAATVVSGGIAPVCRRTQEESSILADQPNSTDCSAHTHSGSSSADLPDRGSVT